MIRYVLLIFVLASFSMPVMAQEGKESATSAAAILPDQEKAGEGAALMSEEAAYETRLGLARQMHEIWPIRPKIERALDRIAMQINPQNRMRFKSAMRKAINYNAVEQTSVEAMADIFTADELEAMIAFYGSKEGRSVSFKTDDYERALQPVFTKMIDKALLDTKLGQ